MSVGNDGIETLICLTSVSNDSVYERISDVVELSCLSSLTVSFVFNDVPVFVPSKFRAEILISATSLVILFRSGGEVPWPKA